MLINYRSFMARLKREATVVECLVCPGEVFLVECLRVCPVSVEFFKSSWKTVSLLERYIRGKDLNGQVIGSFSKSIRDRIRYNLAKVAYGGGWSSYVFTVKV